MSDSGKKNREQGQRHQKPEQQQDADNRLRPKYLPLRRDTIVKLRDQANDFDIPLAELLNAAGNEELKLLFEKPQGSLRVILRPLKQNELIRGQPHFARIPDYFVLQTQSCEHLRDYSQVKIYSSPLGYRTGAHRTALIELPAGDADKDPLFPIEVEGQKHVSPDTKFGYWGSWEFWSDSVPFPLDIRPEDVFVRKEEFKRWRFEHYYPRIKKVPEHEGESDLPIPRDSLLPIEKTPEEYRSSRLRWACEAAHHFWADQSVIFDNDKTWPLDQKIARWLMDHAPAHFPDITPALHAAKLTRPDWTRNK